MRDEKRNEGKLRTGDERKAVIPIEEGSYQTPFQGLPLRVIYHVLSSHHLAFPMPQLELASSHPQIQPTQPAALFVLYLFRIAAIVTYILRGFFTDNYFIFVRLARLPTHLYDSPLFGGRNRCRSPRHGLQELSYAFILRFGMGPILCSIRRLCRNVVGRTFWDQV